MAIREGARSRIRRRLVDQLECRCVILDLEKGFSFRLPVSANCRIRIARAASPRVPWPVSRSQAKLRIEWHRAASTAQVLGSQTLRWALCQVLCWMLRRLSAGLYRKLEFGSQTSGTWEAMSRF